MHGPVDPREISRRPHTCHAGAGGALFDLHLDIIGQGPDRSRLEQLAWSSGMARHIRFHGYVASSVRDRLAAEAWIAVCPSSFEGWGVVCMEASSRGLPVVASNVAGLRVSVRDGETGLLFPYGDVDSLVESVGTLLDDPRLRAEMGLAGVRWAARHTWDGSTTTFASLLAGAVAARPLTADSRAVTACLVGVTDLVETELGSEAETAAISGAPAVALAEPERRSSPRPMLVTLGSVVKPFGGLQIRARLTAELFDILGCRPAVVSTSEPEDLGSVDWARRDLPSPRQAAPATRLPHGWCGSLGSPAGSSSVVGHDSRHPPAHGGGRGVPCSDHLGHQQVPFAPLPGCPGPRQSEQVPAWWLGPGALGFPTLLAGHHDRGGRARPGWRLRPVSRWSWR